MLSKDLLKTAFLSALIFFFAPGETRAAGTVTGEFLLVDVAARETALGGIFAADYARPDAAVCNPAALCGIQKTHIFLSHFLSVFNTYYEQLIYAAPISDKSSFSGQVLFSGNNDVYITDGNGNNIGNVEDYDALVGGVYAFELTPEINLGVNIKIITSKIYSSAIWGAAGNFGFLYRNLDKRYMIGLSAENIGISTEYFKDQSLYPMLLRGGYGTEIFRYLETYKISLYIEERVYLNENENAQTSFGLEAEYEKFFIFRYGYIFGISEGSIALGAGVKFKLFNLDYAYQPFFLSDNVHRFTLEFVF